MIQKVGIPSSEIMQKVTSALSSKEGKHHLSSLGIFDIEVKWSEKCDI